MFTINTRDTKPIFEQIVEQVGTLVALDILKPNSQLPTVRSLARELGINPNTVAKAYHECESKGLIYSLPGKGSFVTEHHDGIEHLRDLAYEDLIEVVYRILNLGTDKETIIRFIKEEIQ